jgi:hypothetical protein
MKKLEILFDKYVFCPGEEVSGQVMFRTDKPIKARNVRLRIMGIERTRVVEGDSDSSYTYVSENHMIDIRDNHLESMVVLYLFEYLNPLYQHIMEGMLLYII